MTTEKTHAIDCDMGEDCTCEPVTLVERLRAEKAELAAKMAACEDGNKIWALSHALASLQEHITNVEKGAPSCRRCGSTSFRAWYVVDEGQGIDVDRDETGALVYEYDGDTETGEAGPDTEYWCRECDLSASTLEYLVGDTDEDRPAVTWAVGRVDCTGEVRRYPSLAEAEARIAEIQLIDPAGVERGDYFIDSPEEL